MWLVKLEMLLMSPPGLRHHLCHISFSRSYRQVFFKWRVKTKCYVCLFYFPGVFSCKLSCQTSQLYVLRLEIKTWKGAWGVGLLLMRPVSRVSKWTGGHQSQTSVARRGSEPPSISLSTSTAARPLSQLVKSAASGRSDVSLVTGMAGRPHCTVLIGDCSLWNVSAHSSSKAVQIELPGCWQGEKHAVLHIPLERLCCCQSVTSLVSLQAVFLCVCVLACWCGARHNSSLSSREHEKMALDGRHDDEPPLLPGQLRAFRFSQIKLTCVCACVLCWLPQLRLATPTNILRAQSTQVR